MVKPKVNAVHLILLLAVMLGVIVASEVFLALSPAALWMKVLCGILLPFAVILVFLRILCITIVKCYQHYAKEQTRRRCLCKPTCSEYALICLKKYNIIKALKKIHRRLFITCNGGFYRMDEP